MADKLRVPAPEELDGDALDPLFLSGAICLLLAAGIFFYFARYQSSPSSEISNSAANTHETTGDEATGDEQLSDEERRAKERTAKLGEKTDEELSRLKWNAQDADAVFSFGPRKAAEAACRDLIHSLDEPKWPDSVRTSLARSVTGREKHAPWTCLLRARFEHRLPTGELRRAVEDYWKALKDFDTDGKIIATVLEDFRETRDRPSHDSFTSWLRICGLNFEHPAGPHCRKLLHQISPNQGEDLLLSAEKHLSGEFDGDGLRTVIQGIGRVAEKGQPESWAVLETEELPDYDVDMRQAAVFILCRFTHSPDEEVAGVAADELSDVAGVGGRAYDEHRLARWRETCRIAFGGGIGRPEEEPVPMLAVWTGREEDPPDYTLKGAVDRGSCETEPGYPIWYCGAKAWKVEDRALEIALSGFFVETRHMEWDEAGPLRIIIPDSDDADEEMSEEKDGAAEASSKTDQPASDSDVPPEDGTEDVREEGATKDTAPEAAAPGDESSEETPSDNSDDSVDSPE